MVALTDVEKTGIKIVALIREGILASFNCEVCNDDMQKKRNCLCESDFTSPVYAHLLVGEFYVCPIKMLPGSIISWLDQYDYYEKYALAAPSYAEVNPRFWEATKFYEQFKQELNKKEETTKKGNDNLGKMASLFKKD